MKAETQKFQFRVYGNFHYMDDSEVFDYGYYEAYKDALVAAKEIVDQFLEHH
jgi:hypothetical protein